MLSGLIRPVRIALSAALKTVPAASTTTFTVQFNRQSREILLFPTVSATPFTVQFYRKSREIPLFPAVPDTTFTVQFYRQSRDFLLFPAVPATTFTVQFCRQCREIPLFPAAPDTTFYNRLSPKMAFLISFSWSKTKRATMALSSAVEGSLMLDADFKRSRTLFRSESIYTVASLESRAL